MLNNPLLRNMLLAALFIVLVGPSYSIFIDHPHLSRELLKNTEEDAVRVGNHLYGFLFSKKQPLTQGQYESESFRQTIDMMLDDFKLWKLRIFSADGYILFSTDSSEIGSRNDTSYFYDKVAQGSPFSLMVVKGAKSMEGTSINLDVVETYVPIMHGSAFLGAFEIYHDVTERKARQDKILFNSSITILIMTVGLFVFFLFVLRHASKSISDREKAMSMITALGHQRQLILNSLSEGVYGIDINSRATFVNASALNMLGWSQSDLVDQKIHNLIHHTHADGSAYPIEDCPVCSFDLERMSERVVSDVFWRKDGTSFPVEFSCAPIVENNKTQGAVVAFRDISERLLQEKEVNDAKIQAEQANSAKSMFLAAMSHEIRTPLNGIIGILDLLRSSSLHDKQGHLIDLASSSADSLLTLISDVLDFSKIEAGKLELDIKPFDLQQLIKELGEIYSQLAQQKQLDFHLDLDKHSATWVLGDQNRIRQILVNFLNNALKFTSSGHIGLRVKSKADSVITFEVSDSGIGISEANQENLFQVFSQADQSTTRQYGGTGLGLAICKKLTEIMQGRLGVRSEPDQGSVFWFEISLPETATSQTFETRAADISDLRVLVVEDNLTNQMVAKKLLTRANAIVSVANNGQEGVDLAMQNDFDVILMDCHMPIIDGYQATSTLRSKGYAKPIIALTANARQEDKQQCFDCGMDDFLSKPFKAQALYRLLAKWRDGRGGRDEMESSEIDAS